MRTRTKTPTLLSEAKVHLLCASLVLFDTFTVNSVLKERKYYTIDRDVDVVELWSGVGTVVAAGAALGLQALPFDMDRVPGEREHRGYHIPGGISTSPWLHHAAQDWWAAAHGSCVLIICLRQLQQLPAPWA